ncbi:MAG: response regulator, partial [Desulfosarcina sp.]|nr:response regulator [Desulfosarcina sp.]
DDNSWQQIEEYISSHSNADFTHGICPECAHRLYPELYQNKG